jgi:hypothetical protein
MRRRSSTARLSPTPRGALLLLPRAQLGAYFADEVTIIRSSSTLAVELLHSAVGLVRWKHFTVEPRLSA